jgi:hypothetical protein
MKILSALLAFVFSVGVATSANAGARASTLCVGDHVGCYATIQAALDAAADGATVHLLPGTYAGGIAIVKSVQLRGAGGRTTIINGGGPVVTIGTAGAPTEPTVSLSGVTITGGLNTATLAIGGGIYVPASSDGLGATVRISDSVISGNHAAPASTVAGCGTHPFGGASGGGIDNAGTMTLDNVSVTSNQAGNDLTSDADGGGIMNERGAKLTVRDSSVTGNIARVTAPIGRFAAGGGIFTRLGSTLTVEDSRIDGNAVDYTTSVSGADHCSGVGQAGGIKIGGDESTNVTIRNSSVTRNAVTASGSGADVIAFAGGIDDDGTLTLTDSTLSGNRVDAAGTAASVDGGALEAEGSATLSDVSVTNNAVTATASSGAAVAQGGAIFNAGVFELRDVAVRDNNAGANGPAGVAQGGGIWNGTIDEDRVAQLDLRDSTVTRNTLTGSDALTKQGGGLYTTEPVTNHDSVITANLPDNCFGC